MPAGELPGRLAPEAMFPAGDARFVVDFVTLRSGLRLRVVQCGDPASAAVAVCVHGWSCSVYSYRMLLPLLAAEGVRAIAIDLQGHGLSDKPSATHFYTLDALVASVRGVMDVLGIERATMVGHSMGGPICARLAAIAPARVSGLALLAPAGFGSEWPIRIGIVLTPRVVAPVLSYLVARSLVGAVLRSAYGSLYRAAERDVDEYWAPSQYREYARAMWDLLHCFDWRAGASGEFAGITAPTVVIDGTDDWMVLHRWVRRYVTEIPGASLIDVPGCGHVVPEEVPLLVRDAVLPLMR